jgi:hypothetical protein
VRIVTFQTPFLAAVINRQVRWHRVVDGNVDNQ